MSKSVTTLCQPYIIVWARLDKVEVVLSIRLVRVVTANFSLGRQSLVPSCGQADS